MGSLISRFIGQPEAGGQQQAAPGWTSTLLRWAMMYFAINMFMSRWRGTPAPTPQTDSEGNEIPIPVSQRPHSPLWKPGTRFNLRIYLSEAQDLFSVIYADNAEESLIFNKYVTLSCNEESFVEKEMNVTIAEIESLQNNGSYYAHIIMAQFGYPFHENDEDYDHTRVLFRTHSLISYRNSDANANVITAFWKQKLTLRPLCDASVYRPGGIPPQISDHYRVEVESNRYWPILYLDDFWLSEGDFVSLERKREKVLLRISVSPISKWKFLLQTQMERQYEQTANPLKLAWSFVVALFQTATTSFGA